MEFEWDEAKHQANLSKHGISFYAAKEVFEGRYLEKRSDRHTEERWICVGKISDSLVTVVYTIRSDRYRIISIRRARNDEKRAYYSLYQ